MFEQIDESLVLKKPKIDRMFQDQEFASFIGTPFRFTGLLNWLALQGAWTFTLFPTTSGGRYYTINIATHEVAYASLLKRLGIMAGILAIMAFGLLLWTLYGQRRHEHPLDRQYRLYCQRLARSGLLRAPGEAPADFARRIAASKPAEAGRAREVALLYTTLRYRPVTTESAVLMRRLQRLAKGA